ncbi:tetratricopeptide (TPR) repeat protein [Methylohalomonas lacus]|uniref:Tetratricopeptide (TPR) repeat protein n=1 Tax=Methylohalomonas lacus TaxID=398773 RepID=A0AAE3HND4_9GAMM|nr:tetratricopeptide repeat protein [Methylohalomonas lacus]MCS3904417.1 tetratricopeptide (TPR) repeat protein [Methylohalomonas lacus]
MSLLMDALRKAEQEKKAAAKRLREQQETQEHQQTGSADSSLQLEDIGAEDKTDTPEADTTDSNDSPQYSTWQAPRTELELTALERAQPLSAATTTETESHPDTTPVAGDETLIELNRDDVSAELDLDVTGQESAPVSAFAHSDAELSLEPDDNTQADEPGNEAFINTNEHLRTDSGIEGTDRKEDNEENEEVTYTDTLREERGPAKKRAGSDSLSYEQLDSPAAARQVFAARRTASSATLTIIVLVLLIVIGLTASGIFYYYSVTPMVRDIASPRVAGEMESRQRPAMELITPTEAPSQVAALPESGSATATTESVPERSATDSEDEETVTEQAALDNTPEQNVTATEPPAAESTQADDSRLASAAETAEAPIEELELSPALLKISRSEGSTDVSQTVNEAYAAYRRGDLEQAQTLYRRVLRDNPEERNALLGLGAIAVQQGRFDAAYRYYADILRQNPADRAAGTALISMQQQSDPASSEARIKRMLADEPNAGYLHQALGNVYAQNQRWPQAQQAYFDAYSNDSDNADYAYNLAVSLDHLGQADTALEYYVRALELATDQPISFTRQSAQARINQIRQAGDIK